MALLITAEGVLKVWFIPISIAFIPYQTTYNSYRFLMHKVRSLDNVAAS